MLQVKKLYKCQKAIRIKKERKKEGALDPNFSLSKIEITNKTGISERSYTKAVSELEDKGYLFYTKERATDGVEEAPLYDFYSRPYRV